MLAEFDAARYSAMTRRPVAGRGRLEWHGARSCTHGWNQRQTGMLDMTHVGTGARVLDVAAGAGEQTMQTAQRVGGQGRVLATDISSNLLAHCGLRTRGGSN